MVYTVFSRGGDIAPVQAQLMQEGLIMRLRQLLEALRQALVKISMRLPTSERRVSLVLDVLADMIDENCPFALESLGDKLPDEASPCQAAGESKAEAPKQAEESKRTAAALEALKQKIAAWQLEEGCAQNL